MKTVVVPTDFSGEADHAIDVAIVIARQMKASILIVNIIQSIYEAGYAATANLPEEGKKVLEADIKKAEKEMADLVKKYEVEDVEIKTAVKVGSIFQDIADNIVQIEADLIVLGTKGDKGLHAFFIGSNAEKVVRRASCPVITVRKKIKNFKLQHVVFATDFTDKPDKLLSILKQWQKQSFFNINLVYVNTPLNFMPSSKVEERMDKFLKKHPDAEFIPAVVDEYSEREGIQKYAIKAGADLIALLTHGKEGLDHVLEGSIAEQIVNRANIPVLTYNLHSFNK